MSKAAMAATCEQRYRQVLPRLSDYVAYYARTRPDSIALIEHNTGIKVSWRKFDQAMNAFAAKLLGIGLRKGDVIATSLPLLKEHIFLEYACFKVGIIIAPLDLRLKAQEVIDAFAQVAPKAYFFLGLTPQADFRPIVREVMRAALSCKTWVQFQQGRDGILDGAQHVGDFSADIKKRFILSTLLGSVRRAAGKVGMRDPALIIFTTGSTGSPKAAMLAHENILVQNIGICVALSVTNADSVLINLPPSHVGCQTELLMTTVYVGGTAVILHIFDAEQSLVAMANHKVTLCGQIPALFAMEWRLPNYASYDLKSLRAVLYSGQAVDRPFLARLKQMAPAVGGGLGLTEAAGLCTVTPLDWTIDEVAGSVGFNLPLCPMSIREPMAADGSAGREKPKGDVGEICFRGPQVFLGYMNDEAATRKTISHDGWCYTGDLGSIDERGVHLAGRAKFVIKPKGYQVFPTEVENFITEAFKDRVLSTACVGVKHEVWTEAIVAFVELRDGFAVDQDELEEKVKDIAAYKRPSHYIFVRQGDMPLNRVAKVDYLALTATAEQEIEKLRQEGKWDRGTVSLPS